ncbi:amino acid ABC transporter substrate-binding protein [Paraburkholderia sediminicola]|uniref:amino acid ABC transporter substrate-binding protein n=1 Tax=Paraburkholderia sediminicola TaxID=458836 RepID=UPI0038B8A78F
MLNRRSFTRAMVATAAVGAAALHGVRLFAQDKKQLRIGFSIAQTGVLGPGGKSGLVAMEVWRDTVNAKGGVLGRPVELVVYDDQSNAASAPAIYSKLVDVDKVDLLLSPYGTNVAGPIVPFAKERGRVLFGMAAIGLNQKVDYDRYFSIGPWGPDPQLTYQAFFQLAKENGLKRVAILAASAEFQQTAASGGRLMAKQNGMQVVFDQQYPANTTDFSGLLQALQQTQPDIVYVCSYPAESAAIVRGVDEIGLPPSVQLFGGGMVGVQNASLLESLGSRLNGIVNYDLFSVDPKLRQPGSAEFLAAYAQRAAAAKVDPLGHFVQPYWYVAGQVIQAAVEATHGTDDKAIAAWLHANPVQTIVGPVRFGANGEWTENRVLMSQFQGVANNDIAQFRTPGKLAIVAPDRFRSGAFKHPFAAAHA